VTRRELARIHRILRTRAGLRQADVAAIVGVGRWKVVSIEAGAFDDLRLSELEGCFESLGARLTISASWRGAALDRMLDELHARLVSAILQILDLSGWISEVEVSFAVFGDRGSIDVLAWHPVERALLVIEVKTELGSLDGLLRPLDVKVRRARQIGLERFGWDCRTVSKLVVVPEDRTMRRRVERFSRIFDNALPSRSRDVRKWLAAPTGQLAGLWFLTDVGLVDTKRNPSSIRRVRRAG
jgi:hypothetical protein